MDWRFRRSISIGGTRIDFGKLETGFDYEFLRFGHRIIRTMRGTVRGMCSIYGTGLSYVAETDNRRSGNFSLPTGGS